MKLVIIGPTHPYRGGIAYFNTLLCQHLSKSHEVLLCSFKKQYPKILFGGRSDRDPSEQVPRIPCRYVLSPLNPSSWLQCLQVVRETKPDALVIHWWVPFWAPAFGSLTRLIRRGSDVPILFLCHNVLPHDPFPMAKLLTQFALGNADAFIVQSDRDLQDLERLKLGNPTMKVLHPSYAELATDRRPCTEARHELGISGPVLLYFGFVRPYKGVKYLLRAIPLVRRTIPVHLLIVGEFWDEKSRYLQLIRELGIEDAVTIIDRYVPNEELGLYFDAADLVVLPYVDTTQSGVVQLAYGFEKPVIGTAVGSLPEVIRDGETGFLVNPRDTDALADGIVRFFNTPGVDWVANVKRTRGRFSWEHLVEVIEQMISQVRP